jgi:hypothetical protein
MYEKLNKNMEEIPRIEILLKCILMDDDAYFMLLVNYEITY